LLFETNSGGETIILTEATKPYTNLRRLASSSMSPQISSPESKSLEGNGRRKLHHALSILVRSGDQPDHWHMLVASPQTSINEVGSKSTTKSSMVVASMAAMFSKVIQ